jgi:uncharacterized damage-inducible protein DinB
MSNQGLGQAADAFEARTKDLVARLERFSDDAAIRHPAEGGWTPAQIAWHVALTNDLFTGVLTGAMPYASPAPAGFKETFSFDSIPPKLKTFPMLEPPVTATKSEALSRLQASTTNVASAMRGLSEERCGYCVNLPFGTLSMRQFGDFAVAHVVRHTKQIERAVASA